MVLKGVKLRDQAPGHEDGEGFEMGHCQQPLEQNPPAQQQHKQETGMDWACTRIVRPNQPAINMAIKKGIFRFHTSCVERHEAEAYVRNSRNQAQVKTGYSSSAVQKILKLESSWVVLAPSRRTWVEMNGCPHMNERGGEISWFTGGGGGWWWWLVVGGWSLMYGGWRLVVGGCWRFALVGGISDCGWRWIIF